MVAITNSQTVPGNNRDNLARLVWNTVDPTPVISTSEALVGGVMQVSVHWTDTTVNIQGSFYKLPAGSALINSADVALPATYEVYAWDTNGTTGLLVCVSTTNPETDPAVNYRYARLATIRLQSVAGTATIFFLQAFVRGC